MADRRGHSRDGWTARLGTARRRRSARGPLAIALALVLGALTVPVPALRAASPAPMELEFVTTAANTTVEIGFSGISNVTIDWGDGTSSTYLSSVNPCGSVRRVYAAAGTYVAKVSGSMTGFGGCSTTTDSVNRHSLTKVLTWGDQTFTSLANAFAFAKNLTDVPATLPPGVTRLDYAFQNATRFNDDISAWDTSQVTSMFGTFLQASSFNQDLGSWNTDKVTTMKQMFNSATSFNNGGNPSIGNWNTGAVANMSYMFASSAFNQPIGNWDTSKVTDFTNMFQSATVFDQPIGTWNTSSAIVMTSMFQAASAFNNGGAPSIGNWDVGKVTKFASMFQSATVFNQPIGTWNTSSSTDMSFMFTDAKAFDQPIGGWDTSKVTNMSFMFLRATKFNRDIGSWSTVNVTNMSYMFFGATLFDNGGSDSIKDWNVEKVRDLTSFAGNTRFNRLIGNWTPRVATTMQGIFSASAMTTPTYDAILKAWEPKVVSGDIPKNLAFGAAGIAASCGAREARSALIATHGWVVADATPTLNCSAPVTYTVTAATSGHVYGSTPPSVGYTVAPALAADDWFTSLQCGASVTSTTPVGSYATTCTGSPNTGKGSLVSYLTGAYTVSPAPAVVVTATPYSFTAGDTPAPLAFTTSGFVNSENFSTLGMTAPTCAAYAASDTSFATPLVINALTAGSYVIRCSHGVVSGNYAGITYVDASLQVLPEDIVVTARDATYVYGDPPASVGHDANLGDGDSIDGLTCGAFDGNDQPVTLTPTTPAGTYVTKCTGASTSGDGAAVTYLPGRLTVTPRLLTVTAREVEVDFGDTPTVAELYDITGFADGEDAEAIETPPTCTSSYSTSTPVGTATTIDCAGAVDDDGNYEFRYLQGSIAVVDPDVGLSNTTGSLWTVPSTSSTAQVTLSATVSPFSAGCYVVFALDPSIGIAGSYSALVDPSGAASTTVALPAGVYNVSVSAIGNCAAVANDPSVVTVAPATVTNGSTGGGWYTLASGDAPTRRVSMGYVVQSSVSKNRLTGASTTTYRGNLVMQAHNEWRLKATIDNALILGRNGSVSGYASWGTFACPPGVYQNGATPVCGSIIGQGILQRWDPEAADGLGDWADVQLVNFTATVYDGRWLTTCQKKSCKTTDLSDHFGMVFRQVPETASLPLGLPVSLPIRLKGGSITSA